MSDRPVSARIRELRRSRQLPQDKLAALINVSKSLITSFESGRLIPMQDTAAMLDNALGAGDEIQRLSREAREDRQPWLRSWIDHERRASMLRNWEPLLIPGLLQCESYMRAIFAGVPDNDAERVEELVANRHARQAATLGREKPVMVNAIIGEMALRTGPSEILKEQLDHLIDLGHRQHLKIRVLPTGVGGLHVGLWGAFAIAGRADGRRVGYMDDPLTGHVATAHCDLARLEVAWLEVDALALSVDQSRDAILRMIDEHR